MRHGYRGFIDYDRNRLRIAPLSERIDWFDDRVHLVVINPLRNILENQVTGISDSSALLIGGVSLLAAMEAGGRFIVGDKGGNYLRFEAFARQMSPELHGGSLNGVPYPKVLWDEFRNGLAHGFAVCHGGFERNRGEAYMAVNAAGDLTVNPLALFDDFERTFGAYVDHLRGAAAGEPLLTMFEKMFERVFIQGK